MKPRLTFAARSLLNSIVITAPPSGIVSTTVFNTRLFRRNLTVYRELERFGRIVILSEANVTATNEIHEKTFITYKIRKQHA